jgi:hypothetical protein
VCVLRLNGFFFEQNQRPSSIGASYCCAAVQVTNCDWPACSQQGWALITSLLLELPPPRSLRPFLEALCSIHKRTNTLTLLHSLPEEPLAEVKTSIVSDHRPSATAAAAAATAAAAAAAAAAEATVRYAAACERGVGVPSDGELSAVPEQSPAKAAASQDRRHRSSASSAFASPLRSDVVFVKRRGHRRRKWQ